MKCYGCEKAVRPPTGLVIENLYDGEVMVMHRGCALRVANRLPEELASELHHQLQIQGIFQDGNRAAFERRIESLRREGNRTAVDALYPEEPTVEQHPLGWVPE